MKQDHHRRDRRHASVSPGVSGPVIRAPMIWAPMIWTPMFWGRLITAIAFAAVAVWPGLAAAREPIARFAAHTPGATMTVDHSAFASFLDAYLVEGEDGINRVRYGTVTAEDHQALKAYVAALAATDVSALDRPEQFAFWANLYNALTLDVVLDAYPVRSIRSIRPGLFSIGPWGKDRVTVDGEALSLDDIEHNILRSHWQDNRVHYAVNCASIGCPNLRAKPFTGATLEADLDDAARRYVTHPRGVAVEDGAVVASKIYRWYGEDFGGKDGTKLEHFRTFAGPDLLARLEGVTRIAGYRYDWDLNDADPR